VTRDPAGTIGELKEQSSKDIWLWGSLKLVHSVLDSGIVDEVRMLACPASRGKGTRIFEDRQDLKLVEGTSFETAWSFCAARSRNRRKVRTFEESDAGDAARLGVGRRPLFRYRLPAVQSTHGVDGSTGLR
jgi:dihydrofolate reductase